MARASLLVGRWGQGSYAVVCEATNEGLEEAGLRKERCQQEKGYKKPRRIPWQLQPGSLPAQLLNPVLDFRNASSFQPPASSSLLNPHFLAPETGWSSRTSSMSGLVTSFLRSPLKTSWMGRRRSKLQARQRLPTPASACVRWSVGGLFPASPRQEATS